MKSTQTTSHISLPHQPPVKVYNDFTKYEIWFTIEFRKKVTLFLWHSACRTQCCGKVWFGFLLKMVSKSFLEVMTSAWGWPEECPLFSLHILTHQCHGFPCMRIQFSNSGTVLIFMKDTSALSKSNLFRLDDCKTHLYLHCFISLLSLIWYYLS